MKKVSVVILTKNCEDTIRDCLESIRRNNYKNTEIIIIDGHSSDKTIEIAKKYTNKIFFDEGKGFFGKARNLGISKAEGDIILFISGDAYIEKNYIKNLLKNMKTCDACCGKEIYKPITKDRFSRIFKEIAIPSKFSTVNFAIKKEIAKKIKFNEKVKASEDQLYFIELKKNANGYLLHTDRGVLQAWDVILATNGYTDNLSPELNRKTFPVGSYSIVTEPLSDEMQHEISPNGRVFWDSK